RPDASAELVVHGPLFVASIGRAAQDRLLCRVGPVHQLDLDAVADRAPAVRASELGGELAQLGLGRADDVAPPGLAQPRPVGGARQAAVGDPHPADHAVTGFHRVDDGLHRAAVVGVAGEHLVAQREAVERHHQGDADLLAVGAVIAAVATTGQPVALGL